MKNRVLNIIINILISFSFLSLATFGIVLIFKTSSTTNFAQGMVGILGAYVTSYLIDQKGISQITGVSSVVITTPLRLILPILAGMLAAFVTGYLIDLFIFRRAKYVNAATKQIITMGLVIVLTGLIPLISGLTVERASFKFVDKTVDIAGYKYSGHDLITIVLAFVILTSLFLALKYTKWGLAVRSVASNEKVAGLMGINTNRINALSWAIAGALGALSAITFTATNSTLNVFSMTGIQINAFYSSVMGGFSTFYGPLVGAGIFNILEIFSKRILPSNLNIYSNVFLYFAIMLIVLIKPNGIFGKKSVSKV